MNKYFNELKEKFWALSNLNESNEIKIIDWAEQIYKAYCDDVQAMAAFVTVLNHKCWYWYERNHVDFTNVYSNLYYKYNDLE